MADLPPWAKPVEAPAGALPAWAKPVEEAAPEVDHSKGHFAEELRDFAPQALSRLRAAVNGATLRHAADLEQGLYNSPLGPALRGVDRLMGVPSEGNYQAEYHQASQEHPGYELLGGLAAPIPGVGSLKALKGAGGFAARLAANTAIGAGAGLALGDTDTPATTRAAVGAGAGLLGGGVGEALGALGAKAAEKVRLATADQGALSAKAAQKAERAARSALGGESSAVLKNFDTVRAVADNAAGIHAPEVVEAAKAKLSDPRYLEVVRNAAKNAVDMGEERLAGSYQTAQNVFESARAGNTPQAIDAAADAALKHPFKTQVLPRMQHYLSRAVPVAVGTAIGGPVGTMAGMATAASLGHPGTALSNMLKSPAFRAGVWGLAQKAAPPLASGLEHEVPSVVEALEPAAAGMPAWAQDPEQQKQETIAALLRRKTP